VAWKQGYVLGAWKPGYVLSLEPGYVFNINSFKPGKKAMLMQISYFFS